MYAADADEPALVMEQSQVTIECSMQYTLKLDKLTDIYAAYELRYHDKMVKEATNAIKNSVSDYLPAKFYQERRQVAQEMQDAVATALDGQNAVLQDFQLRRVTLRPQNDDDVIRKIVTAESQRTALNVQKQKEIDAQKTVRRLGCRGHSVVHWRLTRPRTPAVCANYNRLLLAKKTDSSAFSKLRNSAMRPSFARAQTPKRRSCAWSPRLARTRYCGKRSA